MLFYTIPYLFVLLLSSAFYKLKKIDVPNPIVLFLMLLPATLVSLLRGDVGIDTLNYLGYFKDLRSGNEALQAHEPGFELLSRIIDLLGFNERVNIALISFLTICLLCNSFSKTKNQLLLFSWVVFPLYFVDMTMNGLRYGLAFAIASNAVDALYRKKNFKALLIGLVAISMQYSVALLVFPFLMFNANKKFAIFLAIGLAIIASGIFAFSPLILTYLYDKQDAYKDLLAPAVTSGLVPLIFFIVLFSSFILLSRRKEVSYLLYVFLVLEIISFGIAKITYAGLRLQTLFVFALLIYIKQHFHLIEKRRIFLYILFSVGILSFLILWKNLTAEIEDVQAPMIPYKFFWKTNN